jgi:hypothetical protein
MGRFGLATSIPAILRRKLMNNPDMPRHIEVKDGDQTVAAAEVTTAEGAEGTARTSLHAASGHIAPGTRASLVDGGHGPAR